MDIDKRRVLFSIFCLIVLGLATRGYMAATTTYVWDEDRDWIPVARSISLSTTNIELPVRAGQHPALPAYFIRMGSVVVGDNPVGYRIGSIVAGLLTLIIVARLGLDWAGEHTAFWAVALLAFNEYHVAISALAVEKSYYLFFSCLAIFAFHRLLATRNFRYVYLSAVAVGLAFLCKEIAALIPVAFIAALVVTGKTRYLAHRSVWISSLLCLAIVSPDLLWHAQETGRNTVAAGYDAHLDRIEGLGLTYQPFIFFVRPLVKSVVMTSGRPFYDFAAEYPSMNPVFGLLILLGVILAGVRWWKGSRDSTGGMLLTVFGVVLLFFIVIDTGRPRPGMDPVVWFWVDVTLIPAVLVTGRVLSTCNTAPYRSVVRASVFALGAAWALAATFGNSLGMRSWSLATCPELLSPADDSLRRVTGRLHGCMVCGDGKRLEIKDILVREGPGEFHAPAKSDVAGAISGTTGATVWLRASSPRDGPKRQYVIRFLREAGAAVDTMEAFLLVADSLPRRSRFWACQPDSIA